MTVAKVSQVYAQAVVSNKAMVAQQFVEALTSDDVINPILVADIYSQTLTEDLRMQVADLFVQALVDPHPYPWMCDEVTTGAYCWKLERTDGTVMGFTSHDKDLTIDGITYKAATGFDPTSVDTTNTLSVDNLEIEGMLSSDAITEADLKCGKYDYAKILIFKCNYLNLSDPIFIIRKGCLGEVTFGKNGFQSEVRGMMELLQQQAGEVCQKNCRAHLGDSKCKINLSNYTKTGTVTAVNLDETFYTTLTDMDSAYAYGVITFTSGQNNGAQYEIKDSTQANGMLDLFLPAVFPISVGDTFTVSMGCDGNLSTCKKRFNNILNFRGEPYTPGNIYMANYPVTKTNNTVSVGGNVSRGDYDWGD